MTAGSVTVVDSVVSANVANREGGGLWNSGEGTLAVSSSTVRDNLADLGVVRAAVAARLAVDEVVRRPSDVDAVVEAGLADVLVVKPALVGGITDTMALAERAASGGLDVVLTSIYDGPVGLSAWCHLAASLGGSRAHGLGTATLLADAGAGHLVPRQGVIRLR